MAHRKGLHGFAQIRFGQAARRVKVPNEASRKGRKLVLRFLLAVRARSGDPKDWQAKDPQDYLHPSQMPEQDRIFESVIGDTLGEN